MATARSFMLLSGATLAVLVTVAGLLRALGFGFSQEVSAPVYWIVLFVVLTLAVVLLIFTPPSRSKERRVNLAPPVVQDKMARPRHQTGPSRTAQLPVTRTDVRPRSQKTGQAGQPTKRSPDEHLRRVSGPSPVDDVQPAPAFTQEPSLGNGSEPAPRPDNGQHFAEGKPPSLRNGNAARSPVSGDAGGQHALTQQTQRGTDTHTPPSLRLSNGGTESPEVPRNGNIVPSHLHEARQREERRREELEARRLVLEQRANSAKVSLGLGRISHAGYRQYVKEVERERTLIEGELIALGED